MTGKMKTKINQKGILLLIIWYAFFAMNQMADAEPAGLVEYRESSGTMNIYVSGLYGATEYAVMLLREPDDFSENNLSFLDQVQTASNGTLNLCFVQQNLDATQLAVGGRISGKSSPYTVATFQPMDGHAMDTPEMLSEINEEAFAGSRFHYIYLGNQVQSIGSRAFANCAELKAIHIPISVTQIADDAFTGCGNFIIVCDDGSTACSFAVRNQIPYVLN